MPKLELFDTHCHIHESEFAQKYTESQEELIDEAKGEGVNTLMCVGTDLKSSIEAVSFVQGREGCYCSLAIHPHEVAEHDLKLLLSELESFENLINEGQDKIVAIGECGLDYYYHVDEETRSGQKTLLIKHLDIATKHNLPVIFHIRNPKETPEDSLGKAFEDFFEIIDEYKKIRGVVHSFSAGPEELKGVLERGLYVGLNGIMTFTKQRSQLQAASMVPSNKMVLETDAPFLTPAPFRGTMCKPKHLRQTAEFLSKLRGESLEEVAKYTTENAKALFGI
ncbi:MAG: TatD family hydrolase [Candidatus Saccharibacteria bacterium]|nr:TatD family hydrolase [Candidatus Saccharibacteria bacterium]